MDSSELNSELDFILHGSSISERVICGGQIEIYCPPLPKIARQTTEESKLKTLKCLDESENVLEFILFGDATSIQNSSLVQHRKGRKPLYLRYPEIVPELNKYVQEHGVAAHERRREETTMSCGLSIPEIRQHLFRTVPGLRADQVKLSKSAIHHLFTPPRRNSSSASKYKGLISSKIAPNRNDLTVEHPDQHFASAQCRYVTEMSALFPSEVILMSCDDKNKLTMGLPAVHRLNRIGKFYPLGDAPNYSDHTFPKGKKAKLTPCGYMLMRKGLSRSRSASPNQASFRCTMQRSKSADSIRLPSNFDQFDKKGRLHVRWPHSGPLHLFLKPDCYLPSNSQMHLNNLLKVLKQEAKLKSVLAIMCDGGPDWSTKPLINILNYGRLWKNLNLDCLILVCHAPGSSKFNPIERAWARINHFLAGTTVPDSVNLPTLDGKGFVQRKLGQKQGVYDAAIYEASVRTMAKYWNEKTFDGFPIFGYPICPGKYSPTFSDHEAIMRSFDKFEEHSAWGELRFYASHCIRKHYCPQFTKDNCPTCQKWPVRAEKFMELLRKLGGMIPVPIFNQITRNSYLSFGECCLRLIYGFRDSSDPIFPDQGLPSLLSADPLHSLCEHGCVSYAFSAADYSRHLRIIHGIKT